MEESTLFVNQCLQQYCRWTFVYQRRLALQRLLQTLSNYISVFEFSYFMALYKYCFYLLRILFFSL